MQLAKACQPSSASIIRPNAPRNLHLVAAVMIVVLAVLAPRDQARAQMPSPRDLRMLNGECSSTSHTAEGPINSDLTKRQSRFFCDSAIITVFPNVPGHIMISFLEKRDHKASNIGFGGMLALDGITMDVQRLYRGNNKGVPVTDGACKLFYKGRTLSSIFCGAVVDEEERRSTAVIGFDVRLGR